jgi:hypothetical protein
MSLGYSLRLCDLNRRAPSNLLGVRLGRVCIEHNIPVTEVAQKMKVTRQTVYNWFAGTTTPLPRLTASIVAYIISFD